MPIAADPADAAGCRRRLQLQQLLERRAGRDVAGTWLPIAADPAAAGAFSCSNCSSAAPALPSLAPGCRSLQIRLTRPAAAGAWFLIAADPDATAVRQRFLQLQLE
ncbi:hypothetical protein ACFSR7_05700 [Cohnella sp. GCM10020058]|uniref:hypothetical protein n=1 Tax=Cohnella sp. GCM10020058 TaxID=3317330 RepID=UPI00362AC3BD